MYDAIKNSKSANWSDNPVFSWWLELYTVHILSCQKHIDLHFFIGCLSQMLNNLDWHKNDLSYLVRGLTVYPQTLNRSTLIIKGNRINKDKVNLSNGHENRHTQDPSHNSKKLKGIPQGRLIILKNQSGPSVMNLVKWEWKASDPHIIR